jgi:hypothetical protein
MWIALFALMPIIFGNPSNWKFFVDQSPWLWLNYLTILILGRISRLIYLKHL